MSGRIDRTDRLMGLLPHAIAIDRMVRGVPRGVLRAYIHIYIRVTQHSQIVDHGRVLAGDFHPNTLHTYEG